MKNIKYQNKEYALRYYYKITNIVDDENDKNIAYGEMIGYDKFDILKSINDLYKVKITYIDDERKEVFLEFEDEDEEGETGEYLYFLFHKDKRMLLKDEEKVEQVNYDRYFELMSDDSTFLTTNYRQ